MPNTRQVMVMHQGMGPNGHETCGYHALKNTLLGLMWAQGIIDGRKFVSLRNDPMLFKAVFDATKASANEEGDVDLTLPRFNDLLVKIKNGEFDFSAQGISKASLQALNLDTALIALQTYTYPGAQPIGHQGELTDLKLAISLVQLARTRGSITNRAFAMGLNNEHWISVLLKQNEQGVRNWFFMDSRGSSQHMDSAINKIQSILQKNEQELKDYLYTAYDNVNNIALHHRYRAFFDPKTGLPLPDKKSGYGPTGQESWDAKDFFVTNKANLRDSLLSINNNVQFMNEAGWFTSPGVEEKKRMKILYHIASFISDNVEASSLDKETKEQLSAVCKQLETALSIEKKETAKKEIPIASLSSEEVNAEVAKIKDNRFDIKGNFHTLLPMLLTKDQREQDKISVVPALVDEGSLEAELKKDYTGKDYVVMFYAHKPHTPAMSPFAPNESRAHTSVLLCKVDNGRIQQTLNIDAYHFIDYIDIMGERPGAKPNPHIQKRLVLKTASGAIQRPSWNDMNCVLYSFSIVEQLLNIFKTEPETIHNVFDSNNDMGADITHWLLQEAILAKLKGVYLSRSPQGEYQVDNDLVRAHHDGIREKLAVAFQLEHAPAQHQQSEEEQRQRAAQEEQRRQRGVQEEQRRQSAVQEEQRRQRAAQEEQQRQRAAQEELQRQRAAQEELQRQRTAQEELQRQRTAQEEQQRQRAVQEEEQRQRAVQEEEQRQRTAQEELQRQRTVQEELQRQRAVQEEQQRDKIKEDLNVYKVQFDGLLKELATIKDSLTEKAQRNDKYTNVSNSINTLYKVLNDEMIAFFNNPMKAQYQQCHARCTEAMNNAIEISAQHRGWHGVNPIIKGIIGILATIAVLPALVVAFQSKHGYMGSFFTTPETITSKKVGKIKKQFTQQETEFESKENELSSKIQNK